MILAFLRGKVFRDRCGPLLPASSDAGHDFRNRSACRQAGLLASVHPTRRPSPPVAGKVAKSAFVTVTAAGPLLLSTGFPIKRYCTCTAHSLQKKPYKINFFISLLPAWNSFAGVNCIFQVNIVIFLLCRSGGTGRHARLRGVWATMRVRVPPSAPFISFEIKK